MKHLAIGAALLMSVLLGTPVKAEVPETIAGLYCMDFGGSKCDTPEDMLLLRGDQYTTSDWACVVKMVRKVSSSPLRYEVTRECKYPRNTDEVTEVWSVKGQKVTFSDGTTIWTNLYIDTGGGLILRFMPYRMGQ